MAGATLPYLGSRISLTSYADIRYEGTLWKLDPEASTISLSNVRSMGTEDRRTDRVVAPRDDLFEFIVFRGKDIKDIVVLEPPTADVTTDLLAPVDDAILEAKIAQPSAALSSIANPAPAGRSTSTDHADQRTGGRQNFQQRDDGRQQEGGRGNYSAQQWNNNGYRGGHRTFNRGGGAPGYQQGGRGYGQPRGQYGGQQRYGGRNNYQQPQQQHGDPAERAAAFKEQMSSAFDFDKSNQALKEVEEKLKAVHENDGEQQEEKKEVDEIKYYDPDSFFDRISCEAMEKKDGGQPPRRGYDRQKEREINALTFGLNPLPMNRGPRTFMNQNRGGGRGGYRSGGYQNQGSNYNNNQGGYGGNNNNGYRSDQQPSQRGGPRYYRGGGGGMNGGPRQQQQSSQYGETRSARSASHAAVPPQQQQQQSVVRRGRRAPKKRQSGGAQEPAADFMFDPVRRTWINTRAMNPIVAFVKEAKQRSSKNRKSPQGSPLLQGPKLRPPTTRVVTSRRRRAAAAAPKKLVEVGVQEGGEPVSDVQQRVKKQIAGAKKMLREEEADCDKCSLRPTDGGDWKSVDVNTA